MRRTGTIAVMLVGLAVAGLAWACIECYQETWIGSYDLSVRVETPGDRPRAVRCYVLTSWESAQRACREFPRANPGGEGAVFADPFDGGPLVMPLKMTGVRSCFGRDLHRAQVRGLVIRAEWPDGRWTCQAVYIPDEWETHEVRITLP